MWSDRLIIPRQFRARILKQLYTLRCGTHEVNSAEFRILAEYRP